MANTVRFVARGNDGIALLARLDFKGICASSGSAGSADSPEPSHVIKALGLEKSLADARSRFGLGRQSSADEVEFTTETLSKVVRRVQLAQ